MNQKLFLRMVLIGIFPFSLIAQTVRLDSTHYFLWNTGTGEYALTERGFFTKGSNDSIVEQLYLRLNNGNWINERKDLFTYDADNNRTEWLRQLDNGTGWENDWIWFYTYDSERNVTLKVRQQMNAGTWQNQQKDSCTYNINNQRTEWFIQTWNGSDWVNSSKYIYSYDTNNRLEEFLMKSWNGTSWNDFMKTEYIYDFDDNPVTELRYTWNGFGWGNNFKTNSTFDQDHRPLSIEMFSWNDSDGEWHNYQRQFQEWHPSGAIISWVRQVGYNLPDWTNADSTYHYLSSGVGLQSISDQYTFLIAPNPALDVLYIKLSDYMDFPAEIKIYTASGQEIVHSDINLSDQNITIDVSSFPSGMYFVQLHSPQGGSIQKIAVK